MRSLCVATALCAGLSCASIGRADVITVKHVGEGRGELLRVRYGALDANAYVGQLVHELSNGTGAAASLEGSRITYCAEVTEDSTETGAVYSVDTVGDLPVLLASPSPGARAQAITDLLCTYGASMFSASASDDFGAAMQIVIWEIGLDYDPAVGVSTIDPGAGALTVLGVNGTPLSGAVAAEIAAIISHIDGTGVCNESFGLINLGTQDQIGLIPAPPTAILGAALGLAAFRRRRAR